MSGSVDSAGEEGEREGAVVGCQVDWLFCVRSFSQPLSVHFVLHRSTKSSCRDHRFTPPLPKGDPDPFPFARVARGSGGRAAVASPVSGWVHRSVRLGSTRREGGSGTVVVVVALCSLLCSASSFLGSFLPTLSPVHFIPPPLAYRTLKAIRSVHRRPEVRTFSGRQVDLVGLGVFYLAFGMEWSGSRLS